MAVRRATIDDLPEILRMGRLFCKQVGIDPDLDSMVQTVENLLNSDSGVLLIGDGAMAGAIAYPLYMNQNSIVAQELFWWVDEDKRSKGSGKQLLSAIESWAREIGAHKMNMIGMVSSPAHIDAFYRENGFEPQEITYWKDL